MSRLGSLSSHVHFHLIFIFTSSTLLRQGVCACVYHLNRCKTSYYRRSVWHSCPTTRNEAVGMSGKGNVASFLHLQIYFFLYICIVPPLGAFKSHLGGLIVYRCCFLPSTSTVILFIHIYIYIFTYIFRFISSCHVVALVFFARLMHSTAEFATTVLIKCVCVRARMSKCMQRMHMIVF